jgi:chaperonin GroES
MKTNIKPLFDNVLIKPLEAETTTASGIVLPDSAAQKPQIGEILAIGAGVMDDGEIIKNSMQVKVGQKVIYKKWGGDEVKSGTEMLMIVKQTDILGVLE